MHVDVKVSVWQRVHLNASTTKEDVLNVLKNNNMEDLFAMGYSWENLDNTEAYLSPEENNNQSTIGFFNDDDHENPIWTNQLANQPYHDKVVSFLQLYKRSALKFIGEGKGCNEPEIWTIRMVRNDNAEILATFLYTSEIKYEHDLNILKS